MKFSFRVCACMISKIYRLKSWSMFFLSNLHSRFLISDFAAWHDSLSSFFCIRIHSMPSSLQSAFKNIFLLGSSWANTGDDITYYFNYSNIVVNRGVQDSVGIGCQKWRLQIFMSGFNLVSKYGTYLKYIFISSIK